MAAVASSVASPTLDGAPNGTNGETSGEPLTVFHDPENFNVVHPLAHSWTLWFTKPPSGKGDNWNDLLKNVITFDTVELFWSVWVSELPAKADYHLFKAGVRPEWEDPQNKAGGKWAYTCRERTKDINEHWLQLTLAAIGEVLEDEDDNEVMGAVVNIRKGFYRIGLWTRTAGKAVPASGNTKARDVQQAQQVLVRIGQRFKGVLKLDASEQVEFSSHQDSAHQGSTRAKSKFVV